MYSFTKDELARLYSCRLFKGGDSESDYATHIREFRLAATQSNKQGVRLSAIIFGHPLPSAYWRAEVVKMMNDAAFDPYSGIHVG
ncbi:MAG: hypothetical protein GY822_26755 [Deltaproteobacteria bacterium]|nr:hypothetical protein [Deltaproteobacteria bacterium]